MNPCQRADSEKPSSFFFNSTSHTCSKNEVITTFVLGTLALAMAAAALYGYLADPSWLVGAHVLTGGTIVTGLVLGTLVLAKCIKSCRRERDPKAPSASEDTGGSRGSALSLGSDTGRGVSRNSGNEKRGLDPSHVASSSHAGYTPRRTAFREIFGAKAEEQAESIKYRIDENAALQLWLVANRKSYAVARDLEGQLFALISFQHEFGARATILIAPSPENKEQFTISYLCKSKDFPSIFKDEKKFGHVDDVNFLKELVNPHQSGSFKLWNPIGQNA